MSTDATNSRDTQLPPIRLDPGTAAEPVTCVKCGTALRGSYHTINDQMSCAKCRFAAEETLHGGTSAEGLLRALVYGIGAAIVGAAGYYAFVKITGYEWAAITALVGIGVGKAVNVGGKGHGGRKFQVLALALTWFAMGGAYLPFLGEAASVGAANGQQKIVARLQARADSIDRANESVAEPDSAALAAGTTAHAALKKAKEFKLPFAALVIAMVIGLFTVPLLIAVVSPLSAVIMGVALFRAWKMNAGGGSISVAGPFRLQGAVSVPPAA